MQMGGPFSCLLSRSLDADARRSFSANVVTALLTQYPTAFECDQAAA